ncbi:MAG: chemotaxis protein CheA [Proteobacteria bacterium]|nr:chemotaxis protein CheA [Pseudomonadota bacterium]
MDDQRKAFKEEAYELLTELETSLLELEENPEDKDQIGRVFRAMHTIKGSGAMFGFDEIADFTHNVETVFDRVRSGQISVTRTLVNLTLSARDHIKALLDASDTEDTVDDSQAKMIIDGLQELLASSESDNADDITINEQHPSVEILTTYRIRFTPYPEIFSTGTNPLLLLNELKELGECTIVAHTENIPPLEELRPESCYIYWDIILTTDKDKNAIKDVFIFVEDDSVITIEAVAEEDGFGMTEGGHDKLGEILMKRGELSGENLEKALKSQKRIGEILVNEKLASKTAVKAALAEQSQVKKRIEQRTDLSSASSIRVPAEKLDQLVDLVGELVTVQARLSQKAVNQSDPDLVSIAEEVETLTSGLRDNAMGIRMLQIGTTFATFRRLVRDLSNELGKNIELTTQGGETELDKTVIERLKDPLVHIIRNSIDHGIELPETRRQSGKPETGTIHLSAVHSGAHVLINIRDDGKGLDPDLILKKAIEKGLVQGDEDLTEKEIQSLLFAPGFSTAEKVTDLSGRGVGMDVVKKSIESLRGSIELDSKKGQGTSINLKLPLTLVIIDGLLVKIGAGFFVLPLSSVEECVELPKETEVMKNGRHILNVRGEIVPYIQLRTEYGIRETRPAIEQVVIMDVNGKRVGFVVDHVIGGHQTVIKNLSKAFKDVEDISGATILGDGTVALIIDVNKIVKS